MLTSIFITMDSYQGSVYDPVSLHKYLYANANSVMFTELSGYYSLAETSAAQAVNSILDKAKATYDSAMVRIGMKLIASLTVYVEVHKWDVLIAELLLEKTIFDISTGNVILDSTVLDICNDVTEEGTKSDEEKIDELIDSTVPGRKTKGKTKQREKSGDYDTANEDFDSLGLEDVKEFPGGRVGKLNDDITVTVRDHSTDGRPTLEIRKPSGRGIEIRYGER